jgi:tRNA(Ile)-lysidine synthase
MGTANVREIARRQKLSVEMAARKARHEFLARTAARLRIPAVALAHHADDQLELFFLRFFRGSGSQGLLGMKWRNPSPFDNRVELVRPLLGHASAALSQYAAEHKVPFREDATNASLDIQRNRIRHELLPLLRKRYQPALDDVVTRVLDITGADADLVTETALDWLNRMRNAEYEARGDLSSNAARRSARVRHNKDVSGQGMAFETLPLAVQRRTLQLQLLDLGITADFDLVEQLRLKVNRPVCVGLDKLAAVNASRTMPRFVSRDAKGLVRAEKAQLNAFRRKASPLDLGSSHGKVDFDGVQVFWQHRRHSAHERPPLPANCEWFDADKVGGKILLRHWRPGDRFQPIGMASAIKLQDFFTGQKVPRPRRHQLVLAVSCDGEVFWVEGMRISERFKLTKTTIRRLQWRWQRL